MCPAYQRSEQPPFATIDLLRKPKSTQVLDGTPSNRQDNGCPRSWAMPQLVGPHAATRDLLKLSNSCTTVATFRRKIARSE
jgi:hypothetical protein